MPSATRFLIYLFLFIYPLQSAIIKTGTVLDIKVMDHPELSGKYTVDQDGRIEYPLLVEEKITDISTAELTNDLTFKLARNIDNPLVLISVVNKPEIQVTVLGQVNKPGVVMVVQGATLQEIIMNAGGIIENTADLSKVKVIHKTHPNSPEIYNFEQFLQNGELDKMPQLEADDIVVVLAKKENDNVKVIGAVQKPGIFQYTDTMNVFELVYMAGGPAEKADFSRIRRLSRNSQQSVDEEIIDLQSYIDNGKMDKIPKVNPGDVVIVYSKWFDWKTLLSVINNTLLVIVTIQAFAGIIKK